MPVSRAQRNNEVIHDVRTMRALNAAHSFETMTNPAPFVPAFAQASSFQPYECHRNAGGAVTYVAMEVRHSSGGRFVIGYWPATNEWCCVEVSAGYEAWQPTAVAATMHRVQANAAQRAN